MTTKQAKTQPAPYRRITDHTTAILIQIITQLHSTADPNQAELICHTPGGTSDTHLVSCRILNWLTPTQPVSDYTYRLRQLTGCAYHFLPYGWKPTTPTTWACTQPDCAAGWPTPHTLSPIP